MSSQTESKTWLAGLLGCVIVLGILWAAPMTVEPTLWGAGSWRGISPAWRPLLFAFGLSLALLPSANWLGGLPRRRLLPFGVVAAVVVLAMVLFWWLQSEVFWANAVIIAKAAGRGEVDLKHTLATTLAAGFVVAWRAVGETLKGEDALGLVSVLAGGLFLLGSVALGHSLFPKSLPKARATTLLLVTTGLMQQFCGVAETYPLSLPAQLWVLVLIVRAFDPERADMPGADGASARHSCVTLLFAASVSTGVFVATIFLWPAVLLTLLWRGTLRPVLVQLVAVALPIAIAVISFRQWGRNLEGMLRYSGGMDESYWVPIRAEDGSARTTHFLMFSLEHVAARANAAFLAAPAWIPLGLVACVAGRRSETDRSRTRLSLVLLLAALGSLSYAVLINPDGGPVTEWMETTTGLLVPFVFLIFFVLERVSEVRATTLAVACGSISCLHVFSWALANAGRLS